MMSIRLSEVNVAEGLALVLIETTDMPWSFYMDISRHLWDEMRYSLFGEVAIEATFGDRAVCYHYVITKGSLPWKRRFWGSMPC